MDDLKTKNLEKTYLLSPLPQIKNQNGSNPLSIIKLKENFFFALVLKVTSFVGFRVYKFLYLIKIIRND